jgi:hypothetical protein
MSSILRSFLLGELDWLCLSVHRQHAFLAGSSYIFRHKQLKEEHTKHLSSRTDRVLEKARRRYSLDTAGFSPGTSPSQHPLDSPLSSPIEPILSSCPGRHLVQHSPGDIRDALRTARNEHMSEIDTIVSRLTASLHKDWS